MAAKSWTAASRGSLEGVRTSMASNWDGRVERHQARRAAWAEGWKVSASDWESRRCRGVAGA